MRVVQALQDLAVALGVQGPGLVSCKWLIAFGCFWAEGVRVSSGSAFRTMSGMRIQVGTSDTTPDIRLRFSGLLSLVRFSYIPKTRGT